MPDLKISQLTDGSELLPTDMLPAVRSGANVRVTPGSTAFYKLAVSTVAGVNAIIVSPLLPALPAGTPMMIVIDAYTTQCELRILSTVSGSTATLTAGLIFAHNAGALVMLLPTGEVTPEMYGARADGTDGWLGIQRMMYNAASYGATITNRGSFGVAGGGLFHVSQPVCTITSVHIDKLDLRTRNGFLPTDATGSYRSFLLNLANGITTFISADPATDIITTNAHAMANGYTNKVIFQTPYGGTLPSPIQAGKIYYATDSILSSTTFKISESDGGPTLDLTTAGTVGAFVWTQVGSLSRIYADELRLDLTIPDVSGFICDLQQPCYIHNFRVEMDANAAVAATGLLLGGQISEWGTVFVNPAANCVGIYMTGVGHHINAFNCNGILANDIGILAIGCWGSRMDFVWTEQCGNSGVKLGTNVRGFEVGTWLHASAGTGPALYNTDVNNSYQIGNLFNSSGGGTLLVQDGPRGILMHAWNSTSPGTGESDDAFVIGGIRQAVIAGQYNAPQLTDQITRSVTANYTCRYIDDVLLVDATSNNITITLPHAAGWKGWQITIKRLDGSGNTLTVQAQDGHPIDGITAGYTTLTVYQVLTLVSTGAGWVALASAWTY
jgi:hypothetical protein